MKDLEKRLSIIEEKLGIVNGLPKLSVGAWYKYHYYENWKLCITSIDGNDVMGYGVDLVGGWMRSGKWGVVEDGLDNLIECTPQEIKEVLERESKRRYEVGDKVEFLVSRIPSIITETPYVSTNSSVNAETDCLVSGYVCLFQNGVWAEVLEKTSDKIDLHVGLKFKTPKDDIIYEITDIYFDTVKIGWKGFKDRVDYEVSKVKEYFNDGTWKVYEPKQQQSSLEQDIQQLKDKYKQYKFTITIEDNI